MPSLCHLPIPHAQGRQEGVLLSGPRRKGSSGLWNSFAPSSAALGLLNISMPAIASGSKQLPLQQWPVSRILPSRPWGDGIVRPSYNRNAWHASQSRWPRPANRRPSRYCWGCGGHHTPCMYMSHFILVVIVSLLSFVLN